MGESGERPGTKGGTAVADIRFDIRLALALLALAPRLFQPRVV